MTRSSACSNSAADDLVEQAKTSKTDHKGVLTACRDAALLKTIYAFGLRRAGGVGSGPDRSAAQPEDPRPTGQQGR